MTPSFRDGARCIRHRWARRGGLAENPGVWGIGGAAILIREECAQCGVIRKKVVGDVDRPTRNHGWRLFEADGTPAVS